MKHKPYYLAEQMNFVLPYTKSRPQKNCPTNEDDGNSFGSSYIQVKQEKEIHINEANETSPEIIFTSTTLRPAANTSKMYSHSVSIFQSDDSIDSSLDDSFIPDETPRNQEQVQYSIAEVKKNNQFKNDVKRPLSDDSQKSTLETETKRFCSSFSNNMDDPDISFFKSLLPDIKVMTAMQMRKFKSGVFSLINNILENDE